MPETDGERWIADPGPHALALYIPQVQAAECREAGEAPAVCLGIAERLLWHEVHAVQGFEGRLRPGLRTYRGLSGCSTDHKACKI